MSSLSASILSFCVTILLLLLYLRIRWFLIVVSRKLEMQGMSVMASMIDQVVAKGTAFAEQEGKKYFRATGQKAAPDKRMELAVSYVVDELAAHGLPQLAVDDIERRVESYLGLGVLNTGGNDEGANVFDE